MIYYPVPAHLQEAFKFAGTGKGSLPVTEELCGQVLSLPIFPELNDQQQKKVAEAIKSSLKELSLQLQR
jgi:dTDP-4-amino-4,6-dideoxygalactose transaminase